MTGPILHFTREEFAARQKAACAKMAEQGIGGLVMFRQESMYYLTGYDTMGFTMFQALYMGADGRIALLTRTADRLQSRATSIIDDIRIWYDRAGATPGDDLKKMLEDYGCRGKRLGIEYHAYGLTAQRGKMVDAALEGFCKTVDASDLVRLLRLVKSPKELEYTRKAGALCDLIHKVSLEHVKPGVSTKAIFGKMMDAQMSAGGDPAASRWPFGGGEAKFFGRYHTGENIVGKEDNVLFEPGASYRLYHAASMYNVIVGKVDPRLRDMNKACADAIAACQDVLRPGKTVGEVFAAHQKTFEKAGFGHATQAACGYTMGAMYPPTWMDWPMIYADNLQVIEPGMVFFTHMIVFDQPKDLSMCIGESVIVTDGAAERINHMPREVISV
ncbi:MAG: Xaa-Pro peptidase family protein [Alphaproteobacteria bacterium]|nr:Xaa-Pro peptidase family protein [Alphaproteobacteria bacterium]